VTNWINGALATFAFEVRRSFSVHRLLVAIGLALFPPAMLNVVARIAFVRDSRVAADVIQYMEFSMVFLVALVCLLMLLLWATPNVHSELDFVGWMRTRCAALRRFGRSVVYAGLLGRCLRIGLSRLRCDIFLDRNHFHQTRDGGRCRFLDWRRGDFGNHACGG